MNSDVNLERMARIVRRQRNKIFSCLDVARRKCRVKGFFVAFLDKIEISPRTHEHFLVTKNLVKMKYQIHNELQVI